MSYKISQCVSKVERKQPKACELVNQEGQK